MNSIFRYFLPSEKAIALSYWFVENFPSSEFSGDEYIFYEFISYCNELAVNAEERYLDVFLNTELRHILINTKTHVQGTETLNFDDVSALEEAVRITSQLMQVNYRALKSLEVNVDDFPVDMRQYMNERRKERLTLLLSDTFNTLQVKDSSEEALQNIQVQTELINNIYNVEALQELTDTNEQGVKPYHITDFGLPAIDKDSGGIWSTQLIGIEAQPGTGKTRFALATLYNAAVRNNHNVMFISLEQSKVELEAMLVAKHLFNMFHVQLSDSKILRNQIPDEVKQLVEASRIDLFESGKYGKIVLECPEIFYVESFINKIKSLDKLKGPFNLIAIDYMGLIASEPRQYKADKTLYEIVKEAFRSFKRYVRKSNKAGIAISQFNKEGIEAGKNDKLITTDMAEGGIAVYKNTDYNIAMSMTDEMRLQQRRRFSQPKVRSSAGFGNVIVNTRLGMCYFKQQEAKEV